MHIVGRTSHLPDPQRDYNWNIFVPKPNCVNVWDPNGLTLRAQTASIPGKQIAAIETAFMGMKQYFSGNPQLDGTLAVEFLEFEDRNVDKWLRAWLEAIYGTENALNGGHAIASASKKSEYAVDIVLTIKNQTGDDNQTIRFKNAWIQNVAAVSLSYPGGSAVKYSATFQYDYYETVNR